LEDGVPDSIERKREERREWRRGVDHQERRVWTMQEREIKKEREIARRTYPPATLITRKEVGKKKRKESNEKGSWCVET